MRTHSKKCIVCNKPIEYLYYLNNYGSGKIYNIDYGEYSDVRFSRQEVCRRANGTRISCQETGMCIVCGQNYTTKIHRPVGNMPGLEDKVACAICGEILGTYTCDVNISAETPATVTVVMNFNLHSGLTFARIVPSPFAENNDMFQSTNQVVSNKNSNGTVFTITSTGKLKSNVKVPLRGAFHAMLSVNGNEILFGTGLLYSYSPDINPPKISNIELSGNEWTKSKPITITGTENWTNTVNVKIENDRGSIVFEGNTNVTNNNWSISCTPEIEAGEESRVFTVTVTDACDNSTTKNFDVSKVDGRPPTVTSSDKVTDSEWAREKTFTFTAEDLGIGNVSDSYGIEVPQLVLRSEVNQEGADRKGTVLLDWSGYDITNKYFVIYRKQEDEEKWKTIVGIDEKLNNNTYIDLLGNDKEKPNTPEITIEKDLQAGQIKINQAATDNGTTYIYYIEAYDQNTNELISKSNTN